MAKGKYKKKRKTSHPIANEVFLKRLKDYPEEYTRVYLKLCRDSAKDFAAFYDKFPKKFDNTLPYILFAKQFADAVLLANLDDSKNEEQETREQENVVKISLNGETLLLPQNATMFEFLKAVKTRTEQEVTVTRMIETEIEL